MFINTHHPIYISRLCTFCRVIQRRMLTLYSVNIIPGRNRNRPGICEMDGLWRAMRIRDVITYAIYGKSESYDDTWNTCVRSTLSPRSKIKIHSGIEIYCIE